MLNRRSERTLTVAEGWPSAASLFRAIISNILPFPFSVLPSKQKWLGDATINAVSLKRYTSSNLLLRQPVVNSLDSVDPVVEGEIQLTQSELVLQLEHCLELPGLFGLLLNLSVEVC